MGPLMIPVPSPFMIYITPYIFFIPCALSLIVVILLKRSTINLWAGRASFFVVHWRHLLLWPYIGTILIGLVLQLVTSAGMGDFTSLALLLYDLFYLQTMAITGIHLGIYLARIFLAYGVSAFLLLVLVLLFIPLCMAALGLSNILFHEFFLEFAIPLAIYFALSSIFCSDFVPLRDRRKLAEANIIFLTWQLKPLLQGLKRRFEEDNDLTARRVLERLFSQEGIVGKIILRTMFLIGLTDISIAPFPVDSKARVLANQFQPIKHPVGHWDLTNSQFRKRVFTNRILFVTLVLLTTFSLSTIIWQRPLLQSVAVPLLGGVIALSLILAPFDDLLINRRVSADWIVANILNMFGRLNYFLRDSTIDENEFPSADVHPVTPNHLLLAPSDFADTNGALSLAQQFMENIQNHEFVYNESRLSLAGYQGSLLPFIATAPLVLFIPKTDIFIVLLTIANGASILVLFVGYLLWRMFILSDYSFLGLSRKTLSLAISYFTIIENGIENIGQIDQPYRTNEFMLLPFRGRNMLQLVKKRISKIYEILESGMEIKSIVRMTGLYREAASYALGAFFVLFYSYFMLMQYSPLFMLPGLLLIFALAVFLKNQRQHLEQVLGEMASFQKRIDTVNDMISLLKMHSTWPLYLLTIGEYDDLYYTGRTIETNTGVMLNEAILIPSHAREV